MLRLRPDGTPWDKFLFIMLTFRMGSCLMKIFLVGLIARKNERPVGHVSRRPLLLLLIHVKSRIA